MIVDISNLPNPGVALPTARFTELLAAEAERDRFKHGLDLIHRYGGTTTDEGVACNGSWCAEQARASLQAT